MDLPELGRKITELIRDEEKEKLIGLISQISGRISDFRNKHLKFSQVYDEISVGSSQVQSFCRIRNNSLIYSFETDHITVYREIDGEKSTIDVITYRNNLPYCWNGEFELSEVDQHIIHTFQDLVK